jgi:hypothetical protein
MIRANLPLTALFLAAATAAAAQTPGHETPAGPCPAGVIATITIKNHNIFDLTDPGLPERLRLAYRVANALHVRTRASVIRRDLLVRPGDCFDLDLLIESERLLRANHYLAYARVHHQTNAAGDHDIVVETRDEWSTRLDLRASLDGGISFDGASLRESNFLGTGQTLELFYLDYDANRDYGIAYHTHQLARSRWHLGAALGQTRNGSLALQSLAYPFRTEAGQWAARQEIRWLDRYFDYLVDDDGLEKHLLLPTRTRALDLALLRRFGRVGSQTTLGVAISYSEITFPGDAAAELVHGDDFDGRHPADSTWLQPLQQQLAPLRTLRSLLLLGQRNVTWVKRQGFDSLRGDQDLRLGTDAALAFGRSLTAAAGEHHLYTALDLYGGTEVGDLLLAGRLSGDAQYPLGPRREGWQDIFAQAEALAYWKPAHSARQTLVLRAAAAGALQTRTPFQLILGGDLGVRGYPRTRFPGGRRLLLSLEDRLTFDGPLRNVMDLGATAFFDLGRVWPGDAPYGIDSGWRAAAGLGLRNAFPSGGRRTYRIDLALPIQPDLGWRDLRLILSVGELIGLSGNSRRARVEEMQRFTTRNPFYFPD